MPKSITGTKKSRGRPRTTGIGTQIGMRWQATDLAAIDAYAEAEGLERTEAIRRLVRIGLTKVRKPRT